MADKLVIVESPAKAKTINKMLGGEFTVMSSMGHIRDLPEKTLGVDVDNDFAPKYVLVKSREKIVGELKRAAKKSVEIFLAPDPDREGESIAWHLYETLRPANPKAVFRRVQYNEITAEAVRKAFANPGEIDQNRVDAQQARRLLDRIVGYRVSPLLWRRLKRGLSAGRVQSVALRLVCERESEIRSFVPEAYWVAGAIARKLVDPRDQFRLALASIDGEKARITSDEQAASVASDLAGCGLRVKSVSVKRVQKRPPPPFITSTLQQ
ncbi:MAG: DNA topoisomerase I, partial [Lentisphaerae bacterium]|nr:DNA topoisomerase I [Lentisphaerota bacterium]